jgi:hypothetical protein
MSHLAEVDGRDHTVIMIQVENEVGVLGDSRDRSELANSAFGGPAPKALIEYLEANREDVLPEIRQRWEAAGRRTAGSWQDLFGLGPQTDEIFMAWHYARYVDSVAAAGKAEYDIPMFVNAWLNGPGATPGDFPSGGPLPHVMDIWKAGAPHVDLLTPDIYQPDFENWCRKFTQRGNPLFIPETRREADGARNIFYAIGQHEAIGTSPFAVDSLDQPAEAALNKSYAALRQLAPLILAHQGKGALIGFLLDGERPSVTHKLGEYELEISLDEIFVFKAEIGYGLVIAVGPNEFVGVGSGFRVAFRSTTPGPVMAGIGAVDEGEYRDGAWTPRRRLNGDENDQGRRWRFSNQAISIERCTVYPYE